MRDRYTFSLHDIFMLILRFSHFHNKLLFHFLFVIDFLSYIHSYFLFSIFVIDILHIFLWYTYFWYIYLIFTVIFLSLLIFHFFPSLSHIYGHYTFISIYRATDYISRPSSRLLHMTDFASLHDVSLSSLQPLLTVSLCQLLSSFLSRLLFLSLQLFFTFMRFHVDLAASHTAFFSSFFSACHHRSMPYYMISFSFLISFLRLIFAFDFIYASAMLRLTMLRFLFRFW